MSIYWGHLTDSEQNFMQTQIEPYKGSYVVDTCYKQQILIKTVSGTEI